MSPEMRWRHGAIKEWMVQFQSIHIRMIVNAAATALKSIRADKSHAGRYFGAQKSRVP